MSENVKDAHPPTQPAASTTATRAGHDGSSGHASPGPTQTSRRTCSWSLNVLVFAVGAASLGTEIAAARLLAPYFGASTIVWANTIATVLLALSIGYWVGGRVADRHPSERALSALVLLAAGLLALVPFLARPFLSSATSALDGLSIGGFLGSLAGVMALIAVPVLLLGAVAPFALRLSIADLEQSGSIGGRLYAISTLGSLSGTFLSALLLIPLLGTRRTFLVFAFSLVAAALPRVGRRYLPALLVPVALVFLPATSIGVPIGDRLLTERETVYQYARVVQREDGSRALELNEGHALHSLWRPGTYLTGGYWDDPLVLPFLANISAPANVAVLGDGAGTIARAMTYFYSQARVDAVELDGQLTALGHKYFDLRSGPRLSLITADARPFLLRSHKTYGAIVLDAYRQPYIPFYLVTREFFTQARTHLESHGVLLINVGHPLTSSALERSVTRTLASIFAYTLRDPVTPTNTWLIASDSRLRPSWLKAATPRLPSALHALALATAGRVASVVPGGEIYTDDRAPVEWLIDGSLLDYARHP